MAVGTSLLDAVMLFMTLIGIITLPMVGVWTVVGLVLYIAIYLTLKKEVREIWAIK